MAQLKPFNKTGRNAELQMKSILCKPRNFSLHLLRSCIFD